MFIISIPLTEDNFCYLEKTHPENLSFTKKDELGLIIGSLIKIDSMAKGTADHEINEKLYSKHREISFNNSRFFRSGAKKIKISTIRAVNEKIDRLMKVSLFRYIHQQKAAKPYLMYKDCIYMYIEELGLSESDKLFETLKKFDFRKRKTNGNTTILW